MNKICGIYKITSPTGKIYIGQSVDIINRFRQYKLGHSKQQVKLFNSLKKYGVENHKFEIVEECDRKYLNEKEIFYISKFNSFNSQNGLNLRSGGCQNSLISQETKRRMSESRKGNKNALGLIHSDESKKKMSESKKGIKLTAEHIENMRKASLGRKFSDETKRKIGMKSVGRYFSPEARKKISDAGIGRVHSDETKLKIGLGSLGKTQNKKNKLSKYIGVSVLLPNKRQRTITTKYKARITLKRKSFTIGTFATEIEAAKAYDDFVLKNIPFEIPLNFKVHCTSEKGNNCE